VALGSQRRAGMTAVIQLSYILRGLLRAAKPTYKKGHSITIYIPFVLLESSVEARHLFAEVFSAGIWKLVVEVFCCSLLI
jgi:hypothetical protein